MTRIRRQVWPDFWNEQFQNFSSLNCFFFFFFFWCDWVDSDKTAEYFSSLFCFISFFFLSVTGSVRIRRLNISRHYFVFFFFSLYLLYYARDSCKKWQENEGKLGLISSMDSFKYFSSLSFSFFGVTGSTRTRQLKISRHYFVFSLAFNLLSLYTILRAG